jgi:hypothetical protein
MVGLDEKGRRNQMHVNQQTSNDFEFNFSWHKHFISQERYYGPILYLQYK